MTGPDPQALRDALKRIEMGHYSGPFSFGAADVARKALAGEHRPAPGLVDALREELRIERIASGERDAWMEEARKMRRERDEARGQRPAPGVVDAAREAVRVWRTPASRGMVFTEVIDRLAAALEHDDRPAPGLVEAAREAREVMERFMAISPSMQEAVRKIDAELGENDERP